MASERIQLRIEDEYSGIGLKQADKAVMAFSRTCKTQFDALKQSTAVFGDEVGKVGNIIGTVARGGVLSLVNMAVTASVTYFIDKIKEARAEVAKAKEETKLYATESRKAFQERLAARLEQKIKAENAEIEKQIKLAKEAAQAFSVWANANAAANASATGAEVSGRNLEVEKLRTKLAQETADMEAGPERQRKELENELKIAIEGGKVSILEASRAMSAAGLAVIQQRQKMQKYTDALDPEKLRQLEAAHAAAINQEKIVREQVAQREIAAGKALDDLIDAQGKEAEATKRKAELKAKRADLEKKIAASEEKAQSVRERIAGIDKRIADARERGDKWEKEAQGGRGMIFKDWQRQQREKARQERDERTRWHQDSVDQNREKRIQEFARKHGWRNVSRADQDWMRQREEWKKLQDPKNNPGIKELAKLEEEKKKLASDQLSEMKKLRDDLKKLAVN